MNVANYFKRIGMTVKPQLNIEGLRVLQQLHLYKIPFENLDIHNNQDIVLDIEKIESKIVQHERGGFCYELNGLFFNLLKALGFNVKLISARVANSDGNFSPQFDHMAIIVNLEEEDWLVDVGFGDFIIKPLKIDLNTLQEDKWYSYRIIEHGTAFYKVQRQLIDKEFKDEYIFSTKARQLHEFRGRCYYHQISEASKFTQKKLCTIALPDGRKTISNSKFVVLKNRERSVKAIHSNKNFDLLLKEEFGIEL